MSYWSPSFPELSFPEALVGISSAKAEKPGWEVLALPTQSSQGPCWFLVAYSGDDRIQAGDRKSHFNATHLKAGLGDFVCKEVAGENGRGETLGEWRATEGL